MAESGAPTRLNGAEQKDRFEKRLNSIHAWRPMLYDPVGGIGCRASDKNPDGEIA
jgi:hypothetical protein